MATGVSLRDAGMAAALNHQYAWRFVAHLMVLSYMCRHGPCLMEAAREFCESVGVVPTHPNAWGALVSSMAVADEIQMTGRWAPSRAPRSHARLQPLWRAR